jgi:CRP-like cAMP-binding protein
MTTNAGGEPGLTIFDKILHLRRSRPIDAPGAFTPVQLSVLADQMRDCVFKAGSVILREGEAPTAAYSLVRGRVHVSRRGATLGEVGPGAAVGLGAMVSRDALGLGAVAASDVVALELDRDRLLDVFDDHFSILLEAIRETSYRHLRAVRRLRHVPDLGPGPRPDAPSPPSLDLVGRLLFLKRPGGPFERGALDGLADIAQRARHRAIAPGAALWHEGDQARDACLIVKGTVMCASARPDGPAPFRAVPGTVIGPLESIAAQPRWHDAVAEDAVEVLEHGVDDLIDVFEDHVELATDFLAWVSRNALTLIETTYGPGPELLEFLAGAPSRRQA